jgi:hypothetical protein
VLPRIATIFAILGLLLAGCGTSQKDQYAKDFQKVGQDFRASVQKAGSQVQTNASLQQRVPALKSFKRSVDKLAADLDKLDPPSDLQKPNDQAVQQLRTLSGDLGDYEQAAEDSDALTARKIVPKLQADQTVLMKTLQDLDKKLNAS